MTNYLITGIAGSGKSTLGEALAKRGLAVIETDIGFRQQRDAQSLLPATYHRGDSWNSLAKIAWCIDGDKLLPLLKSTQPGIQFICGYADNWKDYYSYFEKLFLLEADKDTVKARLLSRTTGEWGKHPVELQHAIFNLERYQNEMIAAGAIPLDATLPLERLVDTILSYVYEK